MRALTLKFPPTLRFTDKEYEQFAQANQEVRMELTATGELIVMPPTGGISGRRNADLTTDLNLWNRQTKLGVVFDSSTEFKLPNGAYRSPDAAWIAKERWQALTLKEQETFPPICPDFVIELRSKTDSLSSLRAKMQEYMDNGCRLGFLLNPQKEQIEIYRQNQAQEVLSSAITVSDEAVLPGFELDVRSIFS